MRPLALLLLTACLAVMAGRGLLGPTTPHGHDTVCHALSTIEYARCFQAGELWPRWLPDLSAGYGGPDPLFYAPLVFQVSGHLHAAGLSVAAALNATMLMALALGALGMFLWAESVWGWAGGLLSAVIYTFAPYHTCDVYARCALPELVGMGLAPWLFYWTRRHVDGDARAWRWLTATLALIVGVHALSMVLYGGLLSVYALGLVASRSAWSRCPGLAASAALALALSAGFWVPVLVDSPGLWLVHNGFSERTWSRAFLSLRQLADEPWPGAVNLVPLHLGWPMIALAVIALGVAIALYATGSPGILSWWAFAAAVGAHVVLTHEVSAPVWQHSFLPMLEFPWRFLAPASLGIALLIPVMLRPLAAQAKLGPAAHVAVSLAFIAASLSACAGPPDAADWPSPQALLTSPRTATHYPMYVPAAGRPTLFPARPRFEVCTGDATLTNITETPERHTFHVSARTPAVLDARLFLFDGWTARVDGALASLTREEGCGGMRLALEPGEHDVVLELRGTPLRTLSALTSAAALLILVLPHAAVRRAAPVAAVLLAACALAVVYRRTPLWPSFHAERARALLEAQRYPEAVEQLALVPTGTARQRWAAEQQRLLASAGLTVASWPASNLAYPTVTHRLDLWLDPMVPWSLPCRPPFLMTAAARLEAPVDGDFTFTLEATGTAVLSVDRQLVAGGIDEHAVAHQEGHARLTHGGHDLALYYRSRGAEVALRVFWAPPGQPPCLLPLSALTPAAAITGAFTTGLPGFPTK